MPLSIRVETEFPGLSLLEMQSILPLGEEPIEARWENSRAEIDLARQYAHRDITLVVKDAHVMERTATMLGVSYAHDSKVQDRGVRSLNSPDNDWRDFAMEVGPVLSRSMMVRSCATALRKRTQAERHLQKVLIESLLDNTSPMEVGLLWALRERGARV